MFKNESINNSYLKQIMQKLKTTRIEENLNSFFNEIAINAYLIFIINIFNTPEIISEDKLEFKHDTDFEVQVISSSDEKKYYPVFTDISEVNKFTDKKVDIAVFNFDSYCSFLKNKDIEGIVINPLSENIILEHKMMDDLRNKKIKLQDNYSEQHIATGTKIVLGE